MIVDRASYEIGQSVQRAGMGPGGMAARCGHDPADSGNGLGGGAAQSGGGAGPGLGAGDGLGKD